MGENPEIETEQETTPGSTNVESFDVSAFLAEFENKLWAITPEVLLALGQIQVSAGTIEALRPATSAKPAPPKSSIALIPIHGVITPHGSFFDMLFGDGGGGILNTGNLISQAAADPEVSHIVLDVDSPGGVTDQVPEVADQIWKARSSKPVIAVANTDAGSAAYWLASQAHELNVTPSGRVGSIGVYMGHRDMSEAHARMGVKTTLVSAGKYKVETQPYAPLNDEAKAHMQSQLDDYYGMFTAAVARGRSVTPDFVSNNMGEGRMMLAKRAVAAGMADRVATLGQTLSRLQSGRAKIRGWNDGLGGSAPGINSALDDYESELAATSPALPAEAVVFTAEERHRLLSVLAS
jgi:signal peptide peptidase SppA